MALYKVTATETVFRRLGSPCELKEYRVKFARELRKNGEVVSVGNLTAELELDENHATQLRGDGFLVELVKPPEPAPQKKKAEREGASS